MARAAAVVDRARREVIAVSGPDRLSWLHLLLTQHVSELPAGTGTEALVLDANGRVLHHMVVAHGDGHGVPRHRARRGRAGCWTTCARWSSGPRSSSRDATAELAVLSVVGPETDAVLAAAGVPVPDRPQRRARAGRRRARPADELAGPRCGGSPGARAPSRSSWWDRLCAAGARPAGTLAFEALRVEAVRPRLGVDTDERTIPHEVGWIGSAVHLTKGCYRGQETVARVANLGRPPRRLVLLHLDAGDERLPVTGDPVLRDGRPVGRVGTVVQHHELGPVALALVKRSVPVDAELVAGVDDRAAPARIDPDSVPPEDDDAAPRPRRPAAHPPHSLTPPPLTMWEHFPDK